MSLAEVAALVEVDLLIRALAVGVTLPPLDVGRPAVLEKMCLRDAMVGVCRWRHGGLVHVALGFARLGVKPLYLTLYLHCIQTWVGYNVSQCIHRHHPLYLPSRSLTRINASR